MLGRRKKQEELRKQQELEQKRIEEEKIREEKLREEMEIEKRRAREEAAKIVPYKFSVPDPKPKELIAVLTNMLKKKFPETKKAYLVLTELEDKKGYLLVVDIDAKFYKIIHMYLDGETKKVRNGLPIECILYTKSGNLTEKMEPFYQKVVSESEKSVSIEKDKASGEIVFSAMPQFGIGDKREVPDEKISELEETVVEEPVVEETVVEEPVAEETVAEETVVEETVAEETVAEETVVEENVVEETVAEETVVEDFVTEESFEGETNEEANQPKIVPETKKQLFAMMNRIGEKASEDYVKMANEGFGEFKFYIPCLSETEKKGIREDFAQSDKPVLLINRDSGIKAIVFFTDEEDAQQFAEKSECSLVYIKYKDYKDAFASGKLVQVAAEGIIINPSKEQILLAPDYCLL